VILAIPDGALGEAAERLAVACLHLEGVVVAHCAGARGPDALAALEHVGVPVAQMHPLVSFARSGGRLPSGAAVLVQGSRAAVRVIVRVVRSLGLVPLRGPVDPTLYHAAAAIVSNGAIALAEAGRRLLVAAGVDADQASSVLGPLLVSTGENLATLGLPDALTGPVRRGDHATVARHRKAIGQASPELLALHRQLVVVQEALTRAANRPR
jgi:predicted short-subunit dehydrogenase-like oxidoreductase (DUF2520 family)